MKGEEITGPDSPKKDSDRNMRLFLEGKNARRCTRICARRLASKSLPPKTILRLQILTFESLHICACMLNLAWANLHADVHVDSIFALACNEDWLISAIKWMSFGLIRIIFFARCSQMILTLHLCVRCINSQLLDECIFFLAKERGILYAFCKCDTQA